MIFGFQNFDFCCVFIHAWYINFGQTWTNFGIIISQLVTQFQKMYELFRMVSDFTFVLPFVCDVPTNSGSF